MVCIFGEKYSTSLCLVFGTMEFVWFYTGEILLTFGGTCFTNVLMLSA